MSVRRLLSLIVGLPPGSAIHRALDPDGTGKGWTNQHELLAITAELLDFNNRLFIMANSKKGSKQPKPIFIPRPGKRARRKASSQEMKNIFARKGVPIVTKGGG